LLIQLTDEKLDAAPLVEAVSTPASGAVTLFYGVVRDHNEGRQVLFLEYDAYLELAERQLRTVAEEIRSGYAIDGIAVAHRFGRLEIGETSLLVAVSSAHRANAFAACEAAVDRIKQTVPIWKKEHWADGSVWLDGTPVEHVPGTPAT
jgi:molybdopterin synthase catalytic subunit